MADELNIPTHRFYEPRNNIKLSPNDMGKQWIYASGISKIDEFINAQPWGNPVPGLFALAEPGVWYDPSDLSTLYQDNAGTTPVTAPGQTVGKMLDKSGRGNHATQATLAQRPTYGVNPIIGTRNLLTYSEQFNNAVWTKTGSGLASAPVVTASAAIAPDGTTTADLVVFNLNGGTTTSERSELRQNRGISNTTVYVSSFYIKAATSGDVGKTVRISLDGVTNAAQITLTANYQRVGQTGTSGATNLNYRIETRGTFNNDQVSVHIWGAQFETGSTATAYQKVVSQYEVTQAGVQSTSYLSFDGVDDNMVIPSLPLTGAEPLFLCFGVQRLSTTSVTALTSFGKGGATTTYPGYVLSVRGSASPTYAPQLQTASATGTNNFIGVANTFGDTATRVLSATRTALRVNASGIATTGVTGDFDGWVTQNNRLGCNYNFVNNLFWKGNIYSAIFLAGAVTAGQITSTESWVNSKTGAY